jgi:hypothetical protein
MSGHIRVSTENQVQEFHVPNLQSAPNFVLAARLQLQQRIALAGEPRRRLQRRA